MDGVSLAERLFQANLGMIEVLSVYLGDRLGLYGALVEHGPATPGELAVRADTNERYTREWLEQQAVAGFLTVEDAAAPADARRYALPPEHAGVLVERDSMSFMAPVCRFHVGVGERLAAVLKAFRRGGGVAYSSYGDDAREGQADANRVMFVNLLGTAWLPAVPDVHARLLADPPARVADIGCGTGWSSIAIARAYPNAHVDGFDLDDESVALARQNAASAGVSDRATFHRRDASDPALAGRYDLVTAFECLHDMGRPVEALRAMRRLVAPGGAVIVADERVAERFTAPGDATERLMYGWSVLFCLPTGLADEPSVGTGTILRPAALRGYAEQAGFRAVEVLPIENELWRFYRLVP